MHFNGNTDPGKQRKENQDAFGCRLLWDKQKALLLVVDGVGGYAGGERAAAIARSTIENYMHTPKGDLLTMLREAVIHANNRIVEERKNNPEYFEMCCVLTAVVADMKTDQLYYAHVGDTRLYRYRNGVLQKLTRDHSFVGIREDAGELTEAEAMMHPQRNQILREAGSSMHRMDDEDFLEYGVRDFIYGDQLLLCSDGLTDMLTAKQITAIIEHASPVAEKVNSLILLANEMGGYDNITVVMMQHTSKHEKAAIVIKTAGPSKPNAAIDDPEKNKIKGLLAKIPVRRIILRSLLLLIFFAGTSWYFLKLNEDGESGVLVLPHQEVKVRDSIKDNLLFTTRSSHPAIPGPVEIQVPDTLRITKTVPLDQLQHMADSSGKTLVIIPAGKNTKFPAAKLVDSSIVSNDTIVVRNLQFISFKTAIELNGNKVIRFENVSFDNVPYPVKTRSAAVKKPKSVQPSNP